MTLPLNVLAQPSVARVSEVSSRLEPGLKSLGAKRDVNEQAERFYEGEVNEVFASARMRRAMARSGVEWSFNFAKTPVDALTDRLEIAAVKSTSERATTVIAAMWAANQLDLEIPNIHRRAGEFGDAYVIVWPREDDEVAFEQDDEGLTVPADIGIYYNSSDCVQLFYETENPLRKSHAIKRWQTEDKRWRVDLLFADRIERYLSKKDAKGERAADYEPLVMDWDLIEGDNGQVVEVPVWPAENPFSEVPVFHFRNDRPYGQPEHKGFFGPQDAINKLIISHMAGVDYQSFPQRYALVAQDSDTSEAADVDEDEFSFRIGEEGGENWTGDHGDEAKAQFSADPGSLWFMKGVTGVGQFEVADPDTFLKPMTQYLRFGAQICTTPLRMFDYTDSQQPSGESQAQADGPFVKKVRNRQLSYGATWQDVFQFALRIAGILDADVNVLWAPPNTVDDKAGWETVGLKLTAGVPFEQAMREAGYTADQLEAWAQEQKPSVVDPLDALKLQAEALGVLVRLGASPESAAAVLGLNGLTFTGAVPVTLRVPEGDAAGLEEK